jgi:HlyD family secretion protein
VSYVTVIDVPNPGLKLKPGMTASVSIETGRTDDVLKVPTAALRFTPAAPGAARETRGGALNSPTQDEERSAVWVLTGNQPVRVPVTTGISDGRDTAILDGDLTAGTPVVTGNAMPADSSMPSTSPLLPFTGRGGRGGAR